MVAIPIPGAIETNPQDRASPRDRRSRRIRRDDDRASPPPQRRFRRAIMPSAETRRNRCPASPSRSHKGTSEMARRVIGAGRRSSTRRRWSQGVTERTNALDLEPNVFTLMSPEAIAESLKRSAETSNRRKSGPYRSAMSMLTFYINRAGSNLTPARRRVLERAKRELRRLFGRV